MKSVTFCDQIAYYFIPGKDEDRHGTWQIDAFRFKTRIAQFENIFKNIPKGVRKKVIDGDDAGSQNVIIE